ncbi:3Fe-4S ferredoxin [Mycolicibacterium canariasense]|uniref:Ferredoxin n=1 Tax=Mycolicibacterium canariasense TaxID=228230 RepID=A0A100W9B5_MYCCR|nr:ferredoxin [Mycolicibacterium canariasense]MCV7212881.1 ferredoxin [Mycolicibacterium canariasense]ORV19362.1 ferredoxin [Mycolicibacterium canariasense]GAS93853.1 3Fe-4S ferredoxin [Mycolicibacterium canariasense]
MKIQINRDRCEGHGQCIAVAPDIFDLDDEGIAILLTSESVSEGLAGQAAAAAEVCPVAALMLDAD